MPLKITFNYSPNFNIKKRSKNQIHFIVIHYTGMKNESAAVKRLTEIQSEVSTHYLIKNNGDLINMVPELYIAWHAGKSSWKNYEALNSKSIGIELVNPGHQYGYRNFPKKQINTLVKLLKNLKRRYNINPTNILGHSDISPNRKKDPGEKFPWQLLAKKKLAIWHNLKRNKIKRYRKTKVKNTNQYLFLKNLSKIGYNGKNLKKNSKDKILVVKAFQRRFRQELVNGKIDKECFIIGQNLIKKAN